MWYPNIQIKHECSLATVQPPNQLITGHWLVSVWMQMFPRHGFKVKPVQLVAVASQCFHSIQSKISCKVQCNKIQRHSKAAAAVGGGGGGGGLVKKI
jgi:hypothetical protein